jgi:hypothetical protein
MEQHLRKEQAGFHKHQSCVDLISTLRTILEQEQAGFHKHQSCVDLISTLRTILEQSIEWQVILYVIFTDFENALDSVKREIMWLTLQKYGTQRKIIQIIKILYDRFKCKISHEGKLSDFIEFRNGVRQGCILTPTLLLLILDRVMKRLQWSMKERLEDLDYADDIFLSAQRFCDMDEKLKRLKEEAELVGLHINIKKTKGMRVNNLICKNLV